MFFCVFLMDPGISDEFLYGLSGVIPGLSCAVSTLRQLILSVDCESIDGKVISTGSLSRWTNRQRI